MKNQKISFQAAGTSESLYPAEDGNRPLVVLHVYAGDGRSVVGAMGEIGCGDCSLLVVGGLKWDHDMSPWFCPPPAGNTKPCTGGADAYLRVLLGEILPETLKRIPGTPPFLGIAGYSLAGLFALYAMYRTDRFSRAASASGSLWFPEFAEYAKSRAPKRVPDRLYFSLGDTEAKTRSALMNTVQENTESLARWYRTQGIPTTFELNPGGHFRDTALRTAKGIAALVKE